MENNIINLSVDKERTKGSHAGKNLATRKIASWKKKGWDGNWLEKNKHYLDISRGDIYLLAYCNAYESTLDRSKIDSEKIKSLKELLYVRYNNKNISLGDYLNRSSSSVYNSNFLFPKPKSKVLLDFGFGKFVESKRSYEGLKK